MPLFRMNATVSGLVQGVFFRASTQQRARELGLSGWVQNLASGDVEVLAEGEQWAIESLAEWLKIGPAGAEVANIVKELKPIARREFPKFSITY